MATAEPRIVCIGGGHGLSAALRAARELSPRVTAIVTVADDGGSSGILRDQLGIPAPGDLRMAIAALAVDPERAGLIQYRFREGELAGHPLGNLLIAALADLRGDFAVAVEEVAALAGVRGRVLPATGAPVHLRARVGGQEVTGQVAIARGPGAVDVLALDPPAAAHPTAVEAIEEADLIVLGPGSLFTSLIAALLPDGIVPAIVRSGAHVAFALNLAEQPGETLGLDAVGHVQRLLSHCGGLRLDAVLAHDGPTDGIPAPLAIDVDEFAAAHIPIVTADLRGLGAVHDPDKLAKTLAALLA